MQLHRIVVGALLVMFVVASGASCSLATSSTPTPTTLLPTPTPDPERQAIISFTRQALEIEGIRDELMAYFGGLGTGYNFRRQLELYFSQGVPAKYAPPDGIEGMSSLRNRLLLLDSPQATQAIKDGLLQIYSTELQQVQLQVELDDIIDRIFESGSLISGPRLVFPEITKDNFEDERKKEQPLGPAMWGKLKTPSAWGQAQLLRQQVYIRWAEIQKEHGISLEKEGFAELVGQR